MQSQHNPIFAGKQKYHYGHLFPELEPLHIDHDYLNQLSMLMMAGELEESVFSSSITNGMAIFSQFLAHDITFEVTSSFKNNTGVQYLQNDRTINLDLDCVYGQKEQSFYYNRYDTDKLLLGKEYSWGDCHWHDLLRNEQDIAIIADARNDENIIVSRMQVLFIAFHNRMVDHLRAQGERGNIFLQAKTLCIWYYHWLIIHGYLKQMLMPSIFHYILHEGCKYYTYPNRLPLEFSGAAFRVGHSQSREQVQINHEVSKQLFELGFFSKMEEYVDWRYQFDFGDGKVQFAHKLDTDIVDSFHEIPFITSQVPFDNSLPARNLRRGDVYGLPSGESMAKRLGYDPIQVEETEEMYLPGTPLWFYILREADKLCNGENLGPVGSTILGECFYTIMLHDDWSYLKLCPNWKPSLGRKAGHFDFIDLINFVENNS